MHWHRLLNVLMLPGLLAAGGCDDEPTPDDGPADDDGAATSEALPDDDGPAADDDGPADDGAATSGDAGDTGTPPATTGEEPPAGTTDGGDPETSSSGGTELECSDPADPFDTCGCPCCWVMECFNDQPCCAGWSDCAPEPE